MNFKLSNEIMEKLNSLLPSNKLAFAGVPTPNVLNACIDCGNSCAWDCVSSCHYTCQSYCEKSGANDTDRPCSYMK